MGARCRERSFDAPDPADHGKQAGIVGAAIVIGGTLAYHNALEQQEQIREIIMHRFQEGEVTDAQFRDVFGDRIDPGNLKKYWEL